MQANAGQGNASKAKIIYTHEYINMLLNIYQNFAGALHVDGSNLGPSLIVGLGSYSGGELYVHGRGKLNIRYQCSEFDGNEPHATCPFEGERFTVIYFTHEYINILMYIYI